MAAGAQDNLCASALEAPDSAVVLTPCKINLYLGIHTECAERGYHKVDSIMVPVSLYDEVTVQKSDSLSLSYHYVGEYGKELGFSSGLDVAPEKTAVWRAAALFAEALGVEPNVHIDIKAAIPTSAGLGGSSADAGAVLRALTMLWAPSQGEKLSGPLRQILLEVARKVGADVSFFLDNVAGLFVGAGDTPEQVLRPFEAPLVLVMPKAKGGSTKAVYAEFDREPQELGSYSELCYLLNPLSCGPEAQNAKDDACDEPLDSRVAALMSNNLAAASARLTPEVAEVEQWLKAQPGVIGAQVTGSGTCSFAICSGPDAQDELVRAARAQGWCAWAAQTIDYAPEFYEGLASKRGLTESQCRHQLARAGIFSEPYCDVAVI